MFMARNLNELKTKNIMEIRDELKEMIVNNTASWKKEEGKDEMADIYVDDFLNELLSKFKLFAITSVGTHVCVKCKTNKIYIDETFLCKKCLLKIYDQAN